MAVKPVKYLATARLGKCGTMTLPKEYRDELNLETGTTLTVLRIGDGLILMPEQKHFEQVCDSIAARLENAGVTEAVLQTTLPEVREQLMKRRYPKLFAGEKSQPAGRTKVLKAKGRR